MIRRWFARRFLTETRLNPDPFGRGLDWTVMRPNWWEMGSWCGITDVSPEVARARLDEWQDDQYRNRKAAG